MTTTLENVRVLDLSRVLAGPWASQALADLGADVIKVERPGAGDDTRTWGPPFWEHEDRRLSAYFMSANRGKRSLAIDLSQEKGQELVKELVRHADIVIENFKTGDMAKRGLDYEALSAINPGLIYCSITGFGQTGPYKDRPGYDFMIQAMGGLMSITGEPDEKSSDGPQKAGVALADILTGLYSTIAILAALHERQTSGKGQYIDMALLDVQVAALANQASNYLISGEPPGRLGNAHPNIVPYQSFATHDGYIIVAVGNDTQFERLCEVLARPDLARDPRYQGNDDRVANRDTLAATLQELLREKGTDEWLEILQNASVPCGPINTIDRVFKDPQVQARNMNIDVDGMPLVANPIRFSRSEISYDHAPPLLGQHTKELLNEVLGLSDAEIAELKEQGIIA
ncbi:MAG: CaiB/BaiF CoA-transferase family protein [Pseudomonadales bacterium]